MRWHPGNPGSMKRPDLADITVRNTTVGRSHGKLEPMETKRNWLNKTLIFLALLSWAVVFLGYLVATG